VSAIVVFPEDPRRVSRLRLGQQFKEIRTKHRLSYRQTAKVLCTNISAVVAMESSAVSRWTPSKMAHYILSTRVDHPEIACELAAMAIRFGYPAVDLFGETIKTRYLFKVRVFLSPLFLILAVST